MTLEGKLRVVLGYSPSKSSFTASVSQNNKPIKTKTISHGRDRNLDTAYNDIVKEAKELAKQYRCEFITLPKAQLIERAKTWGSGGKSKTKKTIKPEKPLQENALITKFGNELAFKAMIKHAIKLHGLDKVLEVLDSATTLTKNMQSDIAKQKTIVSAANIKIARVIIETRNQGVQMDAPTKEIESAIQWVMENDRKPKTPSKAEPNVTYRLGKEEWNGVGHAPAGFSKYLNQNENHSLDDLRVN
jgi:hypothetical protein